jgi:hypothetical protein
MGRRGAGIATWLYCQNRDDKLILKLRQSYRTRERLSPSPIGTSIAICQFFTIGIMTLNEAGK